MNKHILRILLGLSLVCVSALMLITNSLNAVAQTLATPTPIITVIPLHLEWTPDSRSVITFSSESGDYSAGVWKKYDVQSGIITQSSEFPSWIQPLTEAERQVFVAAENTDGDKSLEYWSPDGRYFAYASNKLTEGDVEFWQLFIADRTLKRAINTQVPVFNPFDPLNFRVIWNTSSTAFILIQTDISGIPLVSAHISNLNADTVTVKSGQRFELPEVTGVEYRSADAFDLSNDGNKILVIARKNEQNKDYYAQELKLLVYDVTNSSNNKEVAGISGDEITSAHFDPLSTSNIVILSRTTLIHYNLNTLVATTLTPQVNSAQSNYFAFSPNGEWIAYIDVQGKLFVVHIPTLELNSRLQVCVTDKGISTALNAKIKSKNWQAFINEVQAQRGKKITTQCADEMIQMATYLLNNPTPIATPNPTKTPKK